jgi:hypothetical protein
LFFPMQVRGILRIPWSHLMQNGRFNLLNRLIQVGKDGSVHYWGQGRGLPLWTNCLVLHLSYRLRRIEESGVSHRRTC